jgi:ABC-type tungstate transport system substrate-binding protein
VQFVLEMIREGFRLLPTDPDLPGEINRTLRLAFASTAIAILVGVVPAYRLGVSRSRVARWGLTIANAGLGLPAVGIGVFIFFVLPGHTPWGGVWYHTMNGVTVAQTVLALPIVVALGAGAIRDLPEGMIDQARGFGASGWRLAAFAFREARLGVLSAVIVALGSAIAEVGAVTILGGNNNFLTTTLASEILNDMSDNGVAGSAHTSDGGLGIPGAVEHALAVLGLMLFLAASLTAVQQWGALQRRRRFQAVAALGPAVDPVPRTPA